MKSSLLSIIALARSGAPDRAWRMFEDGGFLAVNDDPAALSVQGRLLKDRGKSATGKAQRNFYRDAANAYALAAKMGGGNYPLINAATLSLLAGEKNQARALAQEILKRPESVERETETPYYRAATRAEALLLLDRPEDARSTLAAAIAEAPRAYEDHASTLRQFELILDAAHHHKAWLDAFRPPRCLHFAGLMGVKTGKVEKEIRRSLEPERIGFGYGALAAGADILIAEALLELNAELHLILPAPKAAFRKMSVTAFGKNWEKRFDNILASAQSVRTLSEVDQAPAHLSIVLAAEESMGSAIMQSEILATEAVQLLVLASARKKVDGRSSGSSAIGAIWKRSGRRQIRLQAPQASAARRAPSTKERGTFRLAAILEFDFALAAPSQLDRYLAKLAKIISAGPTPIAKPRWTGAAVEVAFAAAWEGAECALLTAKQAFKGLRIAGHYGIARLMRNPFENGPYLTGAAASLATRIIPSVPEGAVLLSQDLAMALRAETLDEELRLELVGDLPDADGGEVVALYSLKR